MEQTWTQYEDEAASVALAPHQWQFVDETSNQSNLQTSTTNSPTTSESSESSCYDSGYENDEKYGARIITFDSPSPESPQCHSPDLDLFQAENMSDPFAVRMNFKRSYLEKLTSSPSTQMRAAVYALKYREQDEDLHSCILEHLESVSVFSTNERDGS
jgi:hypothetical protein